MTKILECQQSELEKDFEIFCPLLWRLIVAIMTPQAQQRNLKPSPSVNDALHSVGKHEGYFILNHILKLRGANRLVSHAALTGIYLETQGMQR